MRCQAWVDATIYRAEGRCEKKHGIEGGFCRHHLTAIERGGKVKRIGGLTPGNPCATLPRPASGYKRDKKERILSRAQAA